jgi:hypothetical protein
MEMKTLIGVLALSILFIVPAYAKEIGFIEDFSLSQDRLKALEQLIPGSSDYFYYHCLYAQHKNDFPQVHNLLKQWIEKDGYTQPVKEILNRQALLEYKTNPKSALAYIKRELKLRFDHQKETASGQTDLPIRLDEAAIADSRLIERALKRYNNLNGFEDAGLDILPYDRLPADQRRDLLRRIKRPDLPDLAKLVTDDLNYKNSGGFGSLPIHNHLLLTHMDRCLDLMPGLLDNAKFIAAYLTKLKPGDDINIHFDPAEKMAYLRRAWTFAGKLAPAHNSVKVQILYHLLDGHRRLGDYPFDLFMEYIQLPRNADYINPRFLKQTIHQQTKANLKADFDETAGIPPVFSDHVLVTEYLSHFFIKAKNYNHFAPFIKDDYLKALFAQTKITAGIGDLKQWYAMMAPSDYQALKDRVDLDFAPTNPQFFSVDDTVALDLYTKNIQTLIIKIFELNTFNYYYATGQEIDTTINLDGLTATWEKALTYEETPFSRVRRRFTFPEIDKAGIFIVEFIGNGKSSRALIRKGRLYLADTMGPAGHELMIYDENNRRRPDASVWMAGREFQPDEDGNLIIPYTTNPGRRPLILKDGKLCTLAALDHQAETYQLDAGFYADRESLLKGALARVAVRPNLLVNGHPIALSLLENLRLIIETQDLNGISVVKEETDYALSEDKELVFDLQLPENPLHIRFTLKADVRNLSLATTTHLSAQATFALNGIDLTPAVDDVFLSRSNQGYQLTLRGKTGEPKPALPVRITLKHRYFKDTVAQTLQTDVQGRIFLGKLTGIEWVQAGQAESEPRKWTLYGDSASYPANLHGIAGQTLRIPFMGDAAGDRRLKYSLLEKRGQTYMADHSSTLKLRDGFIEISNLPAGNYELFLKESNTAITLRLTEGTYRNGFIISDRRVLEANFAELLQISAVDTQGPALKVTLGNFNETSRLHVWGVRYVPAFHPFIHLNTALPPEPYEITLIRPQSHYVAGRQIGDEYRYILERKYAEKFAGNMLKKPELLLNPWSIRKTQTALDEAETGELFDLQAADAEKRAKSQGRLESAMPPADSYSNMDFLAHPSVALLNLKPDENGVVSIDYQQLGESRQLHLLAVDPVQTVYRSVELAQKTITQRDLRQKGVFDAATHFTERKQISIIDSGQTFQLTDMLTSEFEVYDTLKKVFALFTALSKDAFLETFTFVTGWPLMGKNEQLAKYSKYACHELNFFLYHKDPQFFHDVIRPYLKQKKDPTFLDHWLLNDDLTYYLKPWAFSQLNVAEKILLSRRIPGHGDGIRRFIQDRFDLIPLDVDQNNILFDTALKGRAMEADEFGVAEAKEALSFRMSAELDETAPEPIASSARGFESVAGAPAMAEVRSVPASAMPQKMAQALSKSKKRSVFKPDRKKARAAVRQFYQKTDKTKEWVENNYYKRPIEEQNEELITINPFWQDFAQSPADTPFISKNFIYATKNFSEIMLALAVMDLPFEAGKHTTQVEGRRFFLTAESPLVVFHKEIAPAASGQEKMAILAAQHFFDPNDRYRYAGHERFEKYVTEEFLLYTPYGCQVVLSNPTSSTYKLRALLQIPDGAMPLKKGFYTRNVPVTLDPYETQTLEYFFYFPAPGDFEHYPVQVTQNEEFITSGEPAGLSAVAKFSRTDTQSWDYVSQNGDMADVLEFLATHNLNRLDLHKIAFRLKDRPFFDALIQLMQNRHTYHATLWSYSLYHNTPVLVSEFLKHTDYANRCGAYIDTALLTIDPLARKTYQHKEYHPLINARAHQLGQNKKILNERFYDQYHHYMKYLSYRPALRDEDFLTVTSYLLLQDRIPEALAFFARIDVNRIASRLQYDYLAAYLCFYTEEIQTAETIAAKYQNYPVDHWRNRFRRLSAQLAELKGQRPQATEKEDREARQTRLADTEPSFDFEIEAGQITIHYQHLNTWRVNYYLMDIELLFSKNPFVRQQMSYFSYIRPNESQKMTLNADCGDAATCRYSFKLPDKFKNNNLMVEIVARGQKKTQLYYANALDVQMMENYGYLKAIDTDSNLPLPKTYVKVYARMHDGTARFYKDGYTDLRGRFDYVSLNTDELDAVDKFAILILSETNGAVIREAHKPKR